MNRDKNSAEHQSFIRLLTDKVEGLRLKLLDLSRRNPLVSARVGRRSGAFVQIVDELPDVLVNNLTSGSSMRLVPLPSLDDDPKDELTRAFKNALSEARHVDEAYLEQLQQLDQHEPDALDGAEQLERELKDRVREQLGMPARASKGDTALTQHAKNNGISPSYELPLPMEEHEDGRHTDDDIQTLLLPDELERKLNGILTKGKTWIQESGINVLHAAFGFMEWKEPNSDAVCFSPLVLLPINLEKKRTRQGLEFRVSGRGEEAETNLVLAEKLKHDFGMELPFYAGGSVEDYLKRVCAAPPNNLKIRVRRQVVFGVFPSSRMAMYHDLDPSSAAFEQSDILQTMLLGSEDTSATPFEVEYDVDAPEVEQKVPHLVMDADSSQFSVLVDLAEGRDLAVEGPPGTGKSQTIVNAIACALASGKKVLFVAEKMAALDVVKSRLEFVGLGEFVLPLQAERSTKEQVIQSIRDRVDMEVVRDHRNLEVVLENFRDYRAELGEYVSVIGTKFGNAELTVHEILGKNIATQAVLADLPPVIQKLDFERIQDMSLSQLRSVTDVAESVARSWKKLSNIGKYWHGVRTANIDRFLVEDICDAAESATREFRSASVVERTLTELGMASAQFELDLEQLRNCLNGVEITGASLDPEFIDRLLDETAVSKIDQFVSECDGLRTLEHALGKIILKPKDRVWGERLADVENVCRANGFDTLDLKELKRRQVAEGANLVELKRLADNLGPFFRAFPQCGDFSICDLRCAAEIVGDTDKSALGLRNDKTVAPEAAVVIRQACEIGAKLNVRASELGSRISLQAGHDPQQIRKLASEIATAGSLRFLSPRYRSAKQAYMALSYADRFDRTAAVSDLKELADWLDEKERFFKLPALDSVLGAHHLGVDTNFSAFGKLMDFIEAVDQRLPGVEKLAIRDFLKRADQAVLLSVPAEVAPGWEGKYEELLERIATLSERERCFGGGIAELSALLSEIPAAEQLDIEGVQLLRADVARLHESHRELTESEPLRELIGSRFRGADTVKEDLEPELSIAKALLPISHDWKGLIVELIRRADVEIFRSSLGQYLDSLERATTHLGVLCRLTGQNDRHFLGQRTNAQIADFLEQAVQNSFELYDQSAFASALASFAQAGHHELAGLCQEHSIDLSGLPRITDALTARNLAKRVYREFGSTLGRFQGAKLEGLRAKLAEADRQIIASTRQMLRQRISESASPPPGKRVGRKSELTEWALIEHEINKKKRYTPVRSLTTRAGSALQELKPCWMMSPLAVAQYIPRGTIEFDLCIIDEASQMPPEDALGPLLRSKQTMIVGDTNQLPPTSFFRRMVEEEDADEDEHVLDESVLELANAAFRPKRRLRWHYRSRHSGLINFSNKLVYDDDLIVFPSAYEDRRDMGVSLVHVDGAYRSGVNGPEARTMVDAALNFMETSPDRSLGIVTLNQKQRDLLIEEMEFALRTRPKAANFITHWNEKNDGLESFFVKNLENVQGDERDVIFIGTVYGPEQAGGPVMQRFGPINGLAGKRRLNVLFSRAKEQIVTFSSMTAEDVRADESGNPGTYMLKRWLEYSATGALDGGRQTYRPPDSDFEIFVIDQIKAMGCEAVPQVGVAGYFIDIGVRHPDWPYGFVLGVECDGASYHSSKSARDRDRLRQEVLERLGWHFHRIWSTDWFNDPVREAEKLREAISQRVEDLNRDPDKFTPSSQEVKSSTMAEPIEGDVLSEQDGANSDKPQQDFEDEYRGNSEGVGPGDTVYLRYLNDPDKVLKVILDEKRNDPSNGIVGTFEPLGEALLDAEEGDEIDVLVGSHLRRAVIEKVERGPGLGVTLSQAATRNGPAEAPRGSQTINSCRNDDAPDAAPAAHFPRTLRLDPDDFYHPDYRFTLRDLGLHIIDSFGPITHRHLCQKIARMHGFQRTGSQIRKTIWAAVNRERQIQKGPSGENIFWPRNQLPQATIEFRGRELGGEERAWKDVPHPEKLGLALEAMSSCGSPRMPMDYMVRRIGLGRLTTSTKAQLEALISEAELITPHNGEGY